MVRVVEPVVEPVQSVRPGTLALATIACLGNLTLLALVALFWADRYDASDSATPVEDGALITLVVPRPGSCC